MNEPEPDTPANARRTEMVLTVAGPKQPIPREIYQGLELDHTCARPGAYAAFALPSIFSGQRRTPTPSPHLQALAEARQLKAGERRAQPYVPRAGSVPDQVLAYLRTHGGYLTYGQIALRFELLITSVSGSLQPAVTGGALQRLTIHARTAVALPGYVPTTDDEPVQDAEAQRVMTQRLEREAPPRH
jgi:hypothetical protein